MGLNVCRAYEELVCQPLSFQKIFVVGEREEKKKEVAKGAPFTRRGCTLIYGATKIIAAVKIPRGVFIDRHAFASVTVREMRRPLRRQDCT